mgnify:CR=1 FL=1
MRLLSLPVTELSSVFLGTKGGGSHKARYDLAVDCVAISYVLLIELT